MLVRELFLYFLRQKIQCLFLSLWFCMIFNCLKQINHMHIIIVHSSQSKYIGNRLNKIRLSSTTITIFRIKAILCVALLSGGGCSQNFRQKQTI